MITDLTAWLVNRGITEDYARHSLVNGASGVVAPVAPVSSPVSSPLPNSTPTPAVATLDRAIFSTLKKKPT